MTTEQELNEKLLKFAGVTPDRSPDGEYYPPDFLHSLDACLEHLGPKFWNWSIEKHVSTLTTEPVAWYDAEVRICTDSNSMRLFYREKSPALAFCRAAEQAIDKLEGK